MKIERIKSKKNKKEGEMRYKCRTKIQSFVLMTLFSKCFNYFRKEIQNR